MMFNKLNLTNPKIPLQILLKKINCYIILNYLLLSKNSVLLHLFKLFLSSKILL